MPGISLVTVVVHDYDEAIRFYVDSLGFQVVEDNSVGEGKRWVVVAPRRSDGASLLLAQAVTEDQRSRIGNQTGGRVSLFLSTDDFSADYEHMRAAGVTFLEEPRRESYGMVAVFEDLYGNRWDLIENKAADASWKESTSYFPLKK